MSARLFPLKVEECPLLPTEVRSTLVERFNLVADLLEFCRQIGGTPEPEKVERSGLELARLHSEMAREKYLVGFLGPFQAGKSRTFNSVLRTTAREQPAGVGQGFPTTAVVTRLRRSQDGKNTARLVFLTSRGYEAKRRFLLRRCGFDPDCKDDRKVLDEIHQALAAWDRSVRTWQDSAGNQQPVKRRDMEYLALMLNSYRVFKEYVAEQPTVQEVPFEERGQYLNHPPDPWHQQKPSLSPLLSHVELQFVTSVIPPTLEMVDLPGYDAHCSIDAFVTDEFLQTLQAAFIFCRATDFSAAVEMIVAKLKKLFGMDLDGRVWLVITRCDDINIYPEVKIENQQGSVFEQLGRFMDRLGLPRHQVLFVTNEPRELANRLRDPGFSSALEDALRQAESSWPNLREAWSALQEEGGVTQLRTLITDALPQRIGRAVTRRAEQTLTHLGRDLFNFARMLQEERLSADLPAELARWRNLLRKLALSIVDVDQIFTLSKDIHGTLMAAWERLEVSSDILDYVSRTEGNRGLREEFLSHADPLDRFLRERTVNEWLDKVYEIVLVPLRHHENTEGSLRIPGICEEGVVAYLERCREQDRELATWNDCIPSYSGNHPFEDLPNQSEPIFTGETYLDVFDRKHRVLARQISLALALHVHRRLIKLLEELTEYFRRLRERSDVGRDFALPEKWKKLEAVFTSW